MQLDIQKCELSQIIELRSSFLLEANCQIRYNARHERGWSDSYLLIKDGAPIGYGSVAGQEIRDRYTIFEFYITPPFRNLASTLFQKLISISGVKFIECQSNLPLLHAMLVEFSTNIQTPVVLFSDETVTDLHVPDTVFRKRLKEDIFFKHHYEPEGGHVIESHGEIVATGGFLLHYNFPFADLYMEVREDSRKKGIGAYLIQELKKECYLAGRVPAARCNAENQASRATLLKAGLRIAGVMKIGLVNSIIR